MNDNISLIYRENDLFDEYIPEIEAYLKEKNKTVFTHSFQRGTAKSVIKEWYAEHKASIKESYCFTDLTCSPWEHMSEYMRTVNLDDFLKPAFFNVWKEHNPQVTTAGLLKVSFDSMSDYETVFSDLFSSVFKHQSFDAMYIVSHRMEDHLLGLVSSDEFSVALKQYASKAGMPKENVFIEQYPSYNFDKENNLIIIDRHNDFDFLKSTCLQLPFESFFQDCLEHNFLELDKKEITSSLHKELDHILSRIYK